MTRYEGFGNCHKQKALVPDTSRSLWLRQTVTFPLCRNISDRGKGSDVHTPTINEREQREYWNDKLTRGLWSLSREIKDPAIIYMHWQPGVSGSRAPYQLIKTWRADAINKKVREKLWVGETKGLLSRDMWCKEALLAVEYSNEHLGGEKTFTTDDRWTLHSGTGTINLSIKRVVSVVFHLKYFKVACVLYTLFRVDSFF